MAGPWLPTVERVNQLLMAAGSSPIRQPVYAEELLKRPEISYHAVLEMAGLEMVLATDEAAELEIEVKYEGYVRRQAETVERFRRLDEALIPQWLDYATVPGLSTEVAGASGQGPAAFAGTGVPDARNHAGCGVSAVGLFEERRPWRAITR